MVFGADEWEILKNTAEELGIPEMPENAGLLPDPEDDPLFGTKEEANLRTEYFFFLWKIIEQKVKGSEGRECFLPCALAQFRRAFLDTVSKLWYDPAKEIIEGICSKMPFPYRDWLEKEAVPVIMSGKHFHDMALCYPVLGVQALILVKDYAGHITEVMEAVKDSGLAARHGKVVSVSASESDWHDHCRSVHILEFSDGERMVYKPHSMAADRGFKKWLDRLCDLSGTERFPIAESFDCKKGAFCSFIRHDPLKCPEDAGLYYHRFGFLMGAVFSLGGYDMHAENIMACGAFPLPVDMETVICPPDETLAKNIDQAGFLPSLGTPPGLKPAGTDSLTSRCNDSSNLPFFGDEVYDGKDHAEEIVSGFLEAFGKSETDRKKMREELSSCFEGAQIRLVYRDTANYARLLDFFETPANLKSAAAYNKIVSRMGSRDETIKRMEREALLRLDVPKFDRLLDKSDVDDLYEGILRKDITFAKGQAEIIRYTLKSIRADQGADKKICPGGYPDRTLKQVKSLRGFFENRTVPVMEAAGNRRYYAGSSFGNCPFLLEGGLGAFIALGAYALAYEDEGLMSFLREKSRMFTDISLIGAAMSMRAPGIADGVGGLVFGLCIGLEMGFFGKDAVEAVFRAVFRDVLKDDVIRFLPSGFLHGAEGLLYALERIPGDLRDDPYHEKTGALRELLSDGGHTGIPFGGQRIISENHTLLYGNAGLLYRIDNGDETQGELVRVLQGATAPVKGADAPEGYLYTGFFSGMSGILYALCRNRSKDRIPKI